MVKSFKGANLEILISTTIEKFGILALFTRGKLVTSKIDCCKKNFEGAMFVYVLKWKIVYLLQVLSQLVARFLAYLLILIHFQDKISKTSQYQEVS